MKLPAHNRYDYVPITKRKDYSWPGGQRLAVYFCNNIEYFAFGAGLGSDSAVTGAPQSQRNYAWRDYGNRVGFARVFRALEERKLQASVAMSSRLAERSGQKLSVSDAAPGHASTRAPSPSTAPRKLISRPSTHPMVRPR